MKTVLITGCSSGFGKAAALLFKQRGWNVAASMRKPDAARPWSEPAGLFCPAIDVTKRESIEGGVAATLERFGRLDALVNNAGYALIGVLEGTTDEQVQRQIDTNIVGLIRMTQAVLPTMRKQDGGNIVMLSSIGGRVGLPLTSVYTMTKHAVEGLSDALRYELRPFGIRVKVVEPGAVRTDFVSRSSEYAEHPDYHGMSGKLKAFADKLDRRLPGPERVARTIVQCAEDRSYRLRYPVHHRGVLWPHRALPDGAWRRILQMAVG